MRKLCSLFVMFLMGIAITADAQGTFSAPVELKLGQTMKLMPKENDHPSWFPMTEAYMTFGHFTAPSDGVVRFMLPEIYQIYYQEKDLAGVQTFNAVIEGTTESAHDFAVKGGTDYIVGFPVTEIVDVTFTQETDRKGGHCAYPIEIESFPTTLDLAGGDNWFQINLDKTGLKTILDITTTAGWTGNIQYWQNARTEQSGLASDDINGSAVTFHKNLDPNNTNNTEVLYINVSVKDLVQVKKSISLNLREPMEGETCSLPLLAEIGENAISGDAGDYWFAYVSDEDHNITLTTGSNSEVVFYLPNCGSSNTADINGNHNYSVTAGKTMYIGIRKKDAEASFLNIEKSDVIPGQSCEHPINFTLGESVAIKDRSTGGNMVTTYFNFTAKESGFAIIETICQEWINNYWTMHVRTLCDAPILPMDMEEFEDEKTGELGFRYKVAISAEHTYIFDLTAGSNNGKDIIVTSRFEEAKQGSTCETAIPITALNEDIAIKGEKDLTVWYTYTADKSGFYTIKGCARGTRRVRIGDCNAKETTLSNDNSYDNVYMRGYYNGKIYVEEGTPFFVYIKTNNIPFADEDPFYINVTFSEVRPGETFNTAIEAQAETPYALNTGDEAFETWYYYTIPAQKEQIIELYGNAPIFYTTLSFYADEDTMLKSFGTEPDYTDVQLKNENGQIVGRTYTFNVSDTNRTIYIYVPIADMEGITWNIKGTGNSIGCVRTVATTPTISPNPNNGTFTLSVPDIKEGAFISICNMSGTEIYKAQLNCSPTTISLEGKLPTGVYLVTIFNGETSTTKMIVR